MANVEIIWKTTQKSKSIFSQPSAFSHLVPLSLSRLYSFMPLCRYAVTPSRPSTTEALAKVVHGFTPFHHSYDPCPNHNPSHI